MMEMLYKKKVIRDFLSLFTENYWKQLISHMLEYGIINFKKHHSIAALTPEDIFLVVENLKKEELIFDKKKENKLIDEKVYRSISKEGQAELRKNRKKNNDSNKKNVHSTKSITSGKSVSNSKEKNKNLLTPGKDKRGILKFNSHKEEFGRTKNLTLVKSSGSKSKSNSANKNKIVNTLKKDNSESQIIKKPSKPQEHKVTEILEQKHLNKLKEKRKSMEHKEKDSEKEKISEQLILDVKKEKEKEKENYQREDTSEIIPKTTKIVNKYSNVESRIKSVIDKDKQKFNINKYASVLEKFSNNNNTQNIGSIEQENDHITPRKIEDDEDTSSYIKKVVVAQPQGFDYKQSISSSNIASLEDKLNGLSQKLSKIVSSSESTNINPNSSFNIKACPLGKSKDNNKGYVYEQNINSSNHDEDYLAEDQMDFNKYNLYSGHFNDKDEMENDRENANSDCEDEIYQNNHSDNRYYQNNEE